MAHPRSAIRRSAKRRTSAAGPRRITVSRQFSTIQMAVHGGDREIVVIVLEGREAFREFPLVVIEDVGQTGDAASLWRRRGGCLRSRPE